MTEFLTVDGGTIAYQVTGDGPLVVLAHGIGNDRESYRFVVPQLVAAGYRVAAVDIRGSGESSAEWPSYTRTDIAGDLIAVVRHLGGPAVLVGHSISGGAVTIAAAQAPELVEGIVELAPFTRKMSISLGGMLRVRRYRAGGIRLALAGILGSVKWWHKYLDVATPGRKPADWDDQLRRNAAMLGEPGRMKALQGMGRSTPSDAAAQLGNVRWHARPGLGRPARRGRGDRGGAAGRDRPAVDDRGGGPLPAHPVPRRDGGGAAAVPRGVRACLGPDSTRRPWWRPRPGSPTRWAWPT
jgi:pimeloyl-ACP methyl ester carboxylesterase